MTEKVTATYVDPDSDWAGFYIDGECIYQNHTVSVYDIDIPDGKALESIKTKCINMDYLRANRLPDTLEELEKQINFSEEVEENIDKWKQHLLDTISELEQDYIKLEQWDELFEFDETKGKLLISLFAKISYRNEKTPMGTEPVLELDTDNGNNEETVYKVKEKYS